MIVVTGTLHVEPPIRDGYLADCMEVIAQARRAPGCLDFYLTADPLEPGRINVLEQWESVAAVEAFRGSGPSGEQEQAVSAASVWQHSIASSEPLWIVD